MKKLLSLACLFITILLAGCSGQTNQANSPTTQPTQEDFPLINVYSSKTLGVSFQYLVGIKPNSFEKDNKIFHPGFGTESYLEVLPKPADQKIENSIMDLIKTAGKDPKNCKIITKKPDKNGNTAYIIDLAKPVTYTDAEKAQIKDADKKPVGTMNGDYQKNVIYKQHLVANCSDYANPLGQTNATTLGSKFWYSDAVSKTKFLFIPGTADHHFYEEGTLKFL